MLEKKDVFLLSRIQNACENNYEPHFFDFYDEGFQVKIEDTIKHYGVPYVFFGGNSEALRKMLCIYPEYLSESDLKWPIMGIIFEKTFEVDHRNILGELMHLGITRESIGDIDINDRLVQIIVKEHLADFFLINFNKVKGRNIKPKFIEVKEIQVFVKNFKRLSIVVASERIDGIINKIWGFSRQDSITYIRQGRLRINSLEMIKNDFKIKAGDIISLRGKGKAKIISMDTRTKKGNIRMEIDKYI